MALLLFFSSLNLEKKIIIYCVICIFSYNSVIAGNLHVAVSNLAKCLNSEDALNSCKSLSLFSVCNLIIRSTGRISENV